MGRLQNKVAIITGGSTGIGKATANRFAEEGAKVIIADINDKEGKRVTDEINNNGYLCYYKNLDVTNEGQWEKVISEILSEHKKINILVNNAGVGLAKDIEETSLEDWNLMMNVNATGSFLGLKHAIKAMKNNGEKNSIINRSSIDGQVGEAGLFAYCASKGAVTVMTKAAALYCGENHYDIRVNSVHPGYIHTEMVEEEAKGYGISIEEYFEKLGEIIPIGHVGETIDIANIDLFLASDESKFATGAEFTIDGGWTAQ